MREQIPWEEKRNRLKPHISFARRRKESYASQGSIHLPRTEKIQGPSEFPCMGKTPKNKSNQAINESDWRQGRWRLEEAIHGESGTYQFMCSWFQVDNDRLGGICNRSTK